MYDKLTKNKYVEQVARPTNTSNTYTEALY